MCRPITRRRARTTHALTAAGLFLALSASGLQARFPYMPDPRMTPGDVLPVTKDDVCRPGYSKRVRDVPMAVKTQVYAEYGIRSHRPGEYEVDHLISLELGGSNSIRNLWPESYVTKPWNAHVKDRLENELHRRVCSGQMDLGAAQQEIARDWIAAYRKYFGEPTNQGRKGRRGGRRRASGLTATPTRPRRSAGGSYNLSKGASATLPPQVWVNTESGKYFRPGARYYGKTKQGAYMSEVEAIRRGYKAAK